LGSEWRDVALEDVADEMTVGHVGPMASEYVDEGIPFLRSLNVDPLRINKNDLKFITSEFHSRIRKSRLTPGDVVIVRTGKPGACSVIPDWLIEANCSDLVIVRCGPKLNSRFLAYYVNTVASQHVAAHLVGAVQQHFNVGSARTLRLNLPPLAVQEAIAAVLGALDDKIELNRQMNVTLEGIVRALFQSWFIDFDPIRAKLDGRAPSALDSATAALFPAHLEETPFGHAPVGWEVRSLDKIAHYLNGLALQKYPPGDGPTLPVIKIAQLRKGDSVGADRCNSSLPPDYIVQDGDVLFSWSGSLEVELWCGGSGALNQHLFKVTSPEFPKWFYYLWTLFHLDEFRLIAADKATTMGHIQRGHLTTAKVLVPPRPLLDAMTSTMSPLIDRIITNRTQSRTLAALRDTLLPILLSGELSVIDAMHKGAQLDRKCKSV
jgi:type I restriction enzyme, S subunit